MLKQMQEEGLSFFGLALALSQQQRDELAGAPLSEQDETLFTQTALDSLDKQAAIEAEAQPDFETFLAEWNAASH
jgi:gamma-glutamylcysteine synthetase